MQAAPGNAAIGCDSSMRDWVALHCWVTTNTDLNIPMSQLSAASGSFSPSSRAAAEALLAAAEESARRKSTSDQPSMLADAQALARDSHRQSLRMPTTAPSGPDRHPSIGQPAAQPLLNAWSHPMPRWPDSLFFGTCICVCELVPVHCMTLAQAG